jgi:hypothetical protein
LVRSRSALRARFLPSVAAQPFGLARFGSAAVGVDQSQCGPNPSAVPIPMRSQPQRSQSQCGPNPSAVLGWGPNPSAVPIPLRSPSQCGPHPSAVPIPMRSQSQCGPHPSAVPIPVRSPSTTTTTTTHNLGRSVCVATGTHRLGGPQLRRRFLAGQLPSAVVALCWPDRRTRALMADGSSSNVSESTGAPALHAEPPPYSAPGDAEGTATTDKVAVWTALASRRGHGWPTARKRNHTHRSPPRHRTQRAQLTFSR